MRKGSLELFKWLAPCPMVRVQTQVWLTVQVSDIYHWAILLLLTTSSAEFICRTLKQNFLFHRWNGKPVVMPWKREVQGVVTWSKEAFQFSFTWNSKTNTLGTREELLLSSRCHKICISRSFLFLVSRPFYKTIVRIGKKKSFFKVSIWSGWQSAGGLGYKWASELEKR